VKGEARSVSFYYEGGIIDFVKHINAQKDAIHDKVVYFEGQETDYQMELAMQWNAGYIDNVFSFANNINTHEGGSHLSGFRAALTRTINDYARSKGLLKEKEENLSGEDVREGVVARGPDKDEARQPAGEGLRGAGGQPEARGVPGGAPQ
jgi:DNA gyrase subunit B